MLLGFRFRSARGPLLLGAMLTLVVAMLAGTTARADADLIAQGRLIFEETAGGVGCAYCHGLDARGEGTAGVDAPNIVGALEAAVRSSLAGAVPLMSFISLSEQELQAIVAYLRHLAAPPAPAEEPAQEPAEPSGEEPVDEEPGEDEPEEAPAEEPGATTPANTPSGIVTVNVEVTDAGFNPASIRVQVGQRVQIVLRNRTFDEHHFKIVGLVPEELVWLASPEDLEAAAAAAEDEHAGHDMHADHAAHAEHATDAAAAVEDHDDHDHAPTFVAWRAQAPSGIQPTGEEVHLWAYTYSPGFGRDVAIFTPTTTGTFRVENPLRPDMQAEFIVHD